VAPKSGNDVTTRAAALASGITDDEIEHLIRTGVWQRLHHGVYATFSGALTRAQVLHAALLAAGRGSTLSHQTAAEVLGLVDEPASRIHVTIPANRRVHARINGVVVHRSAKLDEARQPLRDPPRTRVEATVFDLVDVARSLDEAVHWMTAACGRRLTTVPRLRAELSARKRIRWRAELRDALRDIDEGCHSILELRYLRDVERAHRLPTGKRQAHHRRSGGNIYDDVHYPAYGLVIELDGRVAHPAENWARDHDRDNLAADRGDSVLHFGWSAVATTPCEVAMRVAAALAKRGWTGHLRRCKQSECMITDDPSVTDRKTVRDHEKGRSETASDATTS
jgi:very-short-patch-repair endonuclease